MHQYIYFENNNVKSICEWRENILLDGKCVRLKREINYICVYPFTIYVPFALTTSVELHVCVNTLSKEVSCNSMMDKNLLCHLYSMGFVS